MNTMPIELFDFKKSLKKFGDVVVAEFKGAYMFDAPCFRLYIGNDLSPNDGDHWEYISKKDDLKLPHFFRANRALLYTYYLSLKTLERAKSCINNFEIVDPLKVQLIIPYTINCDLSIVSFCLSIIDTTSVFSEV